MSNTHYPTPAPAAAPDADHDREIDDLTRNLAECAKC